MPPRSDPSVDLSPNNVSTSIASSPTSPSPIPAPLSLFPPHPDNRFRTLIRVTLGSSASTTSALASALAVPASRARLPPSARTATSAAIAAIALGESV